MSKKRTLDAYFLAFFLLLSLIPTAGMLIFGESKAGANEILASRPKLFEGEGGLNSAYLSELSDYISDRFFLRQEAITAWNCLNSKLLFTSPARKVALGRGDWLFYAETLNAEPLSEQELWCAGENLRLLQEYAESQGTKFLFVLCPNKSSLFPSKLSRGTPSEDGKAFEALLDELDVNHVSLYASLQERSDLFYVTDSHWNGKGAAVAADAILSALNRRTDYSAGPFYEGAGHAGDLSEMLYPASPTVEQEWLYNLSYRYTSNYHAPNDPLITTVSSRGSGTLSCYRDSFGNDLHPYLSESFRTASFSRKTSFDLTGLDSTVLLIELVERNIDYLYRYDHCYPAPLRSVDTGAAELREALSATLSEASGLVRISGELSDFDPAPIYLRCESGLYECAPKIGGFTLCLSEFSGEAELIYQCGGQLCAAPLNIKE